MHIFSFQVIAEGANGPTTPAAEKVLIENNKLVIPVSFKYHNLALTNALPTNNLVPSVSYLPPPLPPEVREERPWKRDCLTKCHL